MLKELSTFTYIGFVVEHHKIIRDYWCLQTQSFYVTSFYVCKHPSPCDITMSWHHININWIQCDSLCENCRFLKTGLVDHIGVLQIPMSIPDFVQKWYNTEAIVLPEKGDILNSMFKKNMRRKLILKKLWISSYLFVFHFKIVAKLYPGYDLASKVVS